MDYELNTLTIAPLDLFLWITLKYKYRFVKKNISRVIRRSSDCVEQMKWSTTLQHTLIEYHDLYMQVLLEFFMDI